MSAMALILRARRREGHQHQMGQGRASSSFVFSSSVLPGFSPRSPVCVGVVGVDVAASSARSSFLVCRRTASLSERGETRFDATTDGGV